VSLALLMPSYTGSLSVCLSVCSYFVRTYVCMYVLVMCVCMYMIDTTTMDALISHCS